MSDTVYFTPEDCDLETFRALIGQSLDAASVPLAADIAQNVPVYDMTVLCDHLTDPAARRDARDDLAEDARDQPEHGALADGLERDHLLDRDLEADRRGEEDPDQPADDALELVDPHLVRARHVDEAHPRDEGAEQVRADDRADPRVEHERREHQAEVDLVAGARWLTNGWSPADLYVR